MVQNRLLVMKMLLQASNPSGRLDVGDQLNRGSGRRYFKILKTKYENTKIKQKRNTQILKLNNLGTQGLTSAV